MNSTEFEDELERKSLIANGSDHKLTLKDVVAGKQTLAFQLKPQIVILRVSMHCHGCARKVEKHISKLEGVSSYKVDLETKMVVVMGDILPFEVLESVSKVKNAELWNSHEDKE
ncbi:Heavy metal-associated domain, HMA [Sesbania bispinosa]|nr:Heavy metal-associated domain, HMA [Sesbania bispinosa]